MLKNGGWGGGGECPRGPPSLPPSPLAPLQTSAYLALSPTEAKKQVSLSTNTSSLSTPVTPSDTQERAFTPTNTMSSLAASDDPPKAQLATDTMSKIAVSPKVQVTETVSSLATFITPGDAQQIATTFTDNVPSSGILLSSGKYS